MSEFKDSIKVGQVWLVRLDQAYTRLTPCVILHIEKAAVMLHLNFEHRETEYIGWHIRTDDLFIQELDSPSSLK